MAVRRRMLMTRVSQSELGCLLTDRPTLSILAEFACIFPYVCVVCGNKNKHDSDERAPERETHSIALNDAEQVMIFTIAVTIYDESTNPRVRTGVQKATHNTGVERLGYCGSVQEQSFVRLSRSIDFKQRRAALVFSQDVAYVFSILHSKQCWLFESFICGSSHCLSRLKRFLRWQMAAGKRG